MHDPQFQAGAPLAYQNNALGGVNAGHAGITEPDLITVELERLRAKHLELQVQRLVTLRHYEQEVRALMVEQFVAVRDQDRSEDGLVLERLPNGQHAWLRPAS